MERDAPKLIGHITLLIVRVLPGTTRESTGVATPHESSFGRESQDFPAERTIIDLNQAEDVVETVGPPTL